MIKGTILYFFLLISYVVSAQEGFQFEPAGRQKVIIPFQLINNLIFIPISVNGVELTFLLDTGVDETILFSLDDKDEVSFLYVQKIKLRGLGADQSITGLKSSNNVLSFPGLVDRKHDIYIVLDQTFNFSSSIGIPVNGIIGYHFFKNHLIDINYEKKKITVYKDQPKNRKRLKNNYTSLDISVESNKPYTSADIDLTNNIFSAKLLIDLGSSDALWLFQNKSAQIRVPNPNFTDFLGRGFSGDVQGKRARIPKINFKSFAFKGAIAAFPDSTSTNSIAMVEDRVGSIGGEILKRFDIVFDYNRSKVFLRKNKLYDEPFQYNMSGIEVHHQGVTWVKETVEMKTVSQSVNFDVNGEKQENSFTYKFELKPVYAISNIRKDSPAELCGLKKGDVIVSINKKLGYRFSLQQINELLKSEEGKVISMEIEREGKKIGFQFQLKSML